MPAHVLMKQVITGLLYPIENSVKKLIGEPGLELPAIALQPASRSGETATGASPALKPPVPDSQ